MADADTDKTPTPNTPASNAIAAMQRKQNIPGDVVNMATANLPDEQRSTIRGMHAYAVENDLSNVEVGKLLKMSDSTVSLVFRGKYEASIANVVKEMKRFLDNLASPSRKLPFIKTSLYDDIETVCANALEFNRIGYVFGDMQIGKSACLKHYQETHNHGSTIYVEMPTGGSLIQFLTKVAEILRIGAQGRETDLRRRILNAFDDRMLLIVDEAHRAIPGQCGAPKTAIKTIDFIKELFNERQCGVVFCATNVFATAMEQGAVALVMKQLRRRRGIIMRLPSKPSREDLNKFAATYGLPPSAGAARDLESKMIEEEALGMWLTMLRMAAKLAASEKSKLKWDHVIDTEAGLRVWEKAK